MIPSLNYTLSVLVFSFFDFFGFTSLVEPNDHNSVVQGASTVLIRRNNAHLVELEIDTACINCGGQWLINELLLDLNYVSLERAPSAHFADDLARVVLACM